MQDAATARGDDVLMKTLTPIAVGRAARHPLTRVRRAFAHTTAWLRTHWQRASLSNEIGYLSNATDHADLERRLRALERCGRSPLC